MKMLLLLLGLLPAFSYALDAPVVDITATTDGDSVFVRLAWDPVPGAMRYQVFRQDQFIGASTLVSDNASSPFQTAVPTGWNWQQQPDILKFFRVEASDEPLHPVPMIRVPAGTFQMGQVGVAEPVHQVTLTHDFWFGETEVTNQQYLFALNWAYEAGYVTVRNNRAYSHGMIILDLSVNSEIEFIDDGFGICRADNAGFWGFEEASIYDPTNHPVKEVTWFGAACYCDWISEINGVEPYYQGLWDQIPSVRNPYMADGYRLPTEGEWEYVAQYNDDRIFPWGDSEPTCDNATFGDNTVGICLDWTYPVGTLPLGASSIDVKDMAGNVWEWCNDWHGEYENTQQTDPIGLYDGINNRVRRGSSWVNTSSQQKCSYRYSGIGEPGNALWDLGFRICRTAQ